MTIDYDIVVREAIARFFLKDVAEITQATEMAKDLGADSVILMQIMSAIEDDLDITLNFMEFKRSKTVGDLVACVQNPHES